MRRLLVLSLYTLVFAIPSQPILADPEDAVVKVHAAVRFPNPTRPWARDQPVQSFGSGVVIEGKRILTNAHVVAYGSEIYVEDRKGGDKIEATVHTVDIDVDLAILTVKDDRFFDKRGVLPRAPQLPQIQDRVAIYGFPIGGTGMSVTKGEVSRIEYGFYGRSIGPVVQVSAAINPGNSGGPAIVDGKMIGLVVSRLQNAQNIGSIIPNEEVEAFLAGAKRDHYVGKPTLATRMHVQSLENKALRRKFKIDNAVRGVLVQTLSPAAETTALKPFDVLTKIGEYDIDDLGRIQLKSGTRVPYLYLVPKLARDHAVAMMVWRHGQQVPVMVPVTTQDDRLIRPYQGEPLGYFIHGPLVFGQAKSDDITLYARMNRSLSIDNSPLLTRTDDPVRFPGEELVVVSAPMFRHACAKGYMDPVGKVVKDVNGIPIKNLRHLVECLRDCKDEFLTFRFADNFSDLLVFDRKELAAATQEILEDNGISVNRRGSPDMLKVWKASRGAEK